MNHAHLDLLLRGAAKTRSILSFAGGLPAPETFPRRAIAAAAEDAILEMGTGPLQYDWPEGRKPLRDLIAADLRRRGAEVEAADVLITNGAQDAIAIAVDVLAPRSICVDALTYPGALELFRSRGCDVRTEAAEVRYAMPAIANPTGEAATAEAREQMLGARWVLEDDAYADLDYSGEDPAPPLIAAARDRVFHIGTFSKTLLPGLRVGWLVPPRSWLRRVRETKLRRDLHASGLAQAIVERFLVREHFPERLQALRRLYRRRSEAMTIALASVPRLRFRAPRGGFSVWVESELHADETRWLQRALAEGIAFDPGSLFMVREEPGAPLAMRLSYSTISEDRIPDGVARLGRALDRERSARPAA